MFFFFSFFRSWICRTQSTTRDLELAPKPSGSGGSVGSGSRGSNVDLGAFSNGSTGGADSPTNSGAAAAASSAPPAHPSRDILEEVLSKPGPYPMVRKWNKTKTNYFLKGNLSYCIFKMKKLLACWLSSQAKESHLHDNQLKLKKKKKI